MIIRDAEIDWFIAQHFRGAEYKKIWEDYSPTSNWKEAGPFIEQYQIDIRYFDPKFNLDLDEHWMGGLMAKNASGISYYCTAFGSTPLIASMRALSKSLGYK